MLVGDSLGMIARGHDSTVPVSVDEKAAYQTRRVARGSRNAWIIGHLPIGSYHESAIRRCYGRQDGSSQGGSEIVSLKRRYARGAKVVVGEQKRRAR